VAIAWLPGALRIEIEGAIWGSQRATTGDASEGADFQLREIGTRAGYAWVAGAFAVGPFAGVDLEHLDASGFGGAAAFHQSADWGAIAAGALVTWAAAAHVALRLEAELSAPLARPSFVVLDSSSAPASPVHQVSTLGGRAAFGVEFRFP
jgi:hypothetical protein